MIPQAGVATCPTLNFVIIGAVKLTSYLSCNTPCRSFHFLGGGFASRSLVLQHVPPFFLSVTGTIKLTSYLSCNTTCRSFPFSWSASLVLQHVRPYFCYRRLTSYLSCNTPHCSFPFSWSASKSLVLQHVPPLFLYCYGSHQTYIIF
jgi:hypothetical protein